MTFLYFAYGSNMLLERLAHRCPSAHAIGAARTTGQRLGFEKRSIDGSGKAMLIDGGGRDDHVPGVLFEIAKADLDSLDHAEGVGFGYDRNDAFHVLANGTGQTIEATTYVATKIEQGLRPFDWYLALVIAGARQHGLGEQYVATLRRTRYVIDDQKSREERKIALQALRSSGHSDHHGLLGGQE